MNIIRRTPLLFGTKRRDFLRQIALASAFLAVPGAYAEELMRTPAQTEGPFYPDKLPLDTDNDLIIVNDSLSPADGKVTWLTGRVLDSRGDPIRNALVEIWQVDNNGVYIHSKDTRRPLRDTHFQGYGRFLTGSTGDYGFRTIRPVPYPGRAPHIHYKIRRNGKELLTTQCYIKGFADNEKDGIYHGLGEQKNKDAVTVDFAPLKGSRTGELEAKFDVVLGVTPEG